VTSDSRSINERRGEQRKSALQMANERRSTIATLKKKMRKREVDPVRVLNESDHDWYPVASSMQIQDFLLAIPRFGDKTVTDILSEFPVSGKVHVGKLSMARRRELINLIDLLTAS
jgi:hypothetical protein